MRLKIYALAVLPCAVLACSHAAPRPADRPTVAPSKPPRGLVVAAPHREIRSLSEVHPINALAIHGQFLYAGTDDGLLRFVLHRDGTDEHARLTREQGLAGNRITAITADATSGLWVATDGGVSRFKDGVWHNVGVPTAAVAAMAVADDGLWMGGARGLGRLSDGRWQQYLPGVRVSQLLRDPDRSGVWIGSEGEGIFHYAGGAFTAHSLRRGQPIKVVRSLCFTHDGGLLALGQTERGDRLAFHDGRQWTSYEVRPAGAMRWLMRARGEVLLGHDDGVFAIRRADLSLRGPRDLPRGPLQLLPSRSPVAPSAYPLPYFFTQRVAMWVPPELSALTMQNDRLLVGTRHTGAIVVEGGGVAWYRTNRLTGAAEKLKLACAEGRCFLAGGDGRAYRFEAGAFKPIGLGPDARLVAQAFVNDAAGGVLAIHSPPESPTLVVSRWNGAAFDKQFEVDVAAPGNTVSVRFARHDAGQRLWVGLHSVDAQGDRRPWGVAVLGPTGQLTYHRSTLLPEEDRPPGSLALPDDVRDVFFRGDEAWVATDAGVCRVRDGKVDIYTENDGLESEIVYGAAARPDGQVLVATHEGVGRLVGTTWRFDLEHLLGHTSRALAVIGDTLWAGTVRGLIEVPAKGPRRVIDEQLGLAARQVRDLHYEAREQRLWVLTDRGLSLINL